MPNKKTKNPKRWFTVAYLTREGQPHPAHRHENFTQRYCTRKILMEDLIHSMIHWSRGAHVAGAWPGQISEWEVLHGNTNPLFYVHADGSIELIPGELAIS